MIPRSAGQVERVRVCHVGGAPASLWILPPHHGWIRVEHHVLVVILVNVVWTSGQIVSFFKSRP